MTLTADPRKATSACIEFEPENVMPVKRRIDKRRDALTDNERNWLIGKPSGFVEFVPHEKLVALWELCWNLGDEAIRRRGLPARR